MLRVVGKIIGFHGIRGEVKIFPLVDDPDLFNDFEKLVIADLNYTVESLRSHKDCLLIKFREIKDLTMAEAVFQHKSQDLYVEAELNEKLSSTEHYIEDIKGMSLIDADSGTELGLVTNCTDGAQTLLVVRLKDQRELLVPFVAEYIIDIDSAKRVIRARVSEDLLELASET